MARGETSYLAGLGIAGHNSGAALVEVSARHGVRLLGNDEEERFIGVKHFGGYPTQSIESLKQRLASMGLEPRNLHAVLLSWNYISLSSLGIKSVAEHFPRKPGTGPQRCDCRLRFLSHWPSPSAGRRNSWGHNSSSAHGSR